MYNWVKKFDRKTIVKNHLIILLSRCKFNRSKLRLTLLPDFCAHISQCGNLKSVSLANAQEILIPKFCNVLINWRKQLAPLVVYSSKRFGLITLHFRSLTLLWRRLEPLWGVMTQLPLPLPQRCSGIYLASFLTVDNTSSKEIFVHCLTFTNKT